MGWVGGGLALIAVVLAAATLHDLLQARTQLVAARSALQAAVDDPAALRTADGRAKAIADVDAAVASISVARQRVVHSRAFSATALVPGLRGQRAGLIGLINDSGAAAGIGRELLGSIDALASTNQLTGGVVPLDGLAQLQQQVKQSGQAIGALVAPHTSLWGPLGTARRQFDQVAGTSARRLVGGADALGAARSFMGATGTRRYFVALQNNAEMRDQGMVLSYTTIEFSNGRLTIDKGGSIIPLALAQPAVTAVPEGTRQVFGEARPTVRWQAVNASADFGFSGGAMVDMYRQATGKSVDGVIAIDIPGVSALLRAVGPVTIDGASEPITADNAGRVLLHDFYNGLTYTSSTSDQAARYEHEADVIRVVGDRLTTGTRDAVALGRELGDAAKGGHLRLYSATAGEEQTFEHTGLGGGPATVDADRTFHVAVENRAGSKVDYYVKPTVREDVTLTPQGAAVVKTTVTVDNQSPVTNQPSYQLGPDEFTKKPGDYLAWVLLWGPAGSVQQAGVSESGLNLSSHVTDVSAGQKRVVTFETVIPTAVRNGRLHLRLVPQSRLEPVQLDVHLDPGRWRVDGPRAWAGPWDSVRVFDWGVRR